MKKIFTVGIALIVLASAMVAVSGCKKTEPQPASQPGSQAESQMENLDKAADTDQAVDIETAFKDAGIEVTPEMKATIDQAKAGAEQTVCPVMGGKVDKNIFVEYNGKKVYFCCSACKDSFNADPEKYLSKLPQFGGKE